MPIMARPWKTKKLDLTLDFDSTNEAGASFKEFSLNLSTDEEI